MQSSQTSRRNAFTLVELLAVLALLSICAAIVIPSVFQSYQKFRILDQSVDSVMNSILLAKRLAIQKSTPYAYEFRNGGNVQFVYPLCDSSRKKAEELASSVCLLGETQNRYEMIRLIFREDGSTDGFAMRIESQNRSERIQVQRHLGIPQRIVEK